MAQWGTDSSGKSVVVGGAPGQTSGSGMGGGGQGGTIWEGDKIVSVGGVPVSSERIIESTPYLRSYRDEAGNIHVQTDPTGRFNVGEGSRMYDTVIGGFVGGYSGSGFQRMAQTELLSSSIQKAAEQNFLIAQAGSKAVEAGLISGYKVSSPEQPDQYFLTLPLAQRYTDFSNKPLQPVVQSEQIDQYHQAGWSVLTPQTYAERYGLPFDKQDWQNAPYFIEHPKYGKMINVNRIRFEAQENEFRMALGSVTKQEARYGQYKGDIGKDLYVLTEELIIPQLFGAKVNQVYKSFFGVGGEEVIAERQLTIERGRYYSQPILSDEPAPIQDTAGWSLGTIPVQAYAMGGVFKLGTLGARWGLRGGAGALESIGLPPLAKVALGAEKAVEPVAIVGGLGYIGYDVYKTHQTYGVDVARGQAAVALASLPFAVMGWQDVSKAHSSFLTLGKTEVPAPISENVLLGKTTFPEIEQGTKPNKFLKSFESEPSALKAWHATGESKGAEFFVEYPVSKTGEFIPGHKGDVPGLYVSPEQYGASPFFLRVSSEYSGSLKDMVKGFFQSEPLNIAVEHLELSGVKRLPQSVRTQLEGAREFLKPEEMGGKAEKGIAYPTVSAERFMKGIGGKSEAEAVITTGTQFKRVSSDTFFKFKGYSIPIEEYVIVEGMGKPSATVSKLTLKEPKFNIYEYTSSKKGIGQSFASLYALKSEKQIAKDVFDMTPKYAKTDKYDSGMSRIIRSADREIQKTQRYADASYKPSSESYYPTKERYTSSSERYILDTTRYELTPEHYTLIGDRYNPSDRYNPPSDRYNPFSDRYTPDNHKVPYYKPPPDKPPSSPPKYPLLKYNFGKKAKSRRDIDFFFGFRESPIMPVFGFSGKKPEAGLFKGTYKETMGIDSKTKELMKELI